MTTITGCEMTSFMIYLLYLMVFIVTGGVNGINNSNSSVKNGPNQFFKVNAMFKAERKADRRRARLKASKPSDDEINSLESTLLIYQPVQSQENDEDVATNSIPNGKVTLNRQELLHQAIVKAKEHRLHKERLSAPIIPMTAITRVPKRVFSINDSNEPDKKQKPNPNLPIIKQRDTHTVLHSRFSAKCSRKNCNRAINDSIDSNFESMANSFTELELEDSFKSTMKLLKNSNLTYRNPNQLSYGIPKRTGKKSHSLVHPT